MDGWRTHEWRDGRMEIEVEEQMKRLDEQMSGGCREDEPG